MTDMDSTIKDFEAAIAELETIVKKLEDGDLPLEKSLELYERGVQLSRFCHARLEDAEKGIEILNERGELRPAAAAVGEAEERCPPPPPCSSPWRGAGRRSMPRFRDSSPPRLRVPPSSAKRCDTA